MYWKLLYGNSRKQMTQLLVIFLLLTILFSSLVYSFHRQSLIQEQIEEARMTIDIKVKIDRRPGQDYFYSLVFNPFTDTRLTPYVRDLAVRSGAVILDDSFSFEGMDQIPEEALDYHEIMGMSRVEAEQTLAGQIVWFPGYSPDVFDSEELNTVLLPQTLYEALPPDVKRISLKLTPFEDCPEKPENPNDAVVTFDIAGYIQQMGSSPTCSWRALCNWSRRVYKNDLKYNYDLSFVLADNSRLEEFRQLSKDVLAEIRIYDEVYYDRMNSLNRHAAYIEILIPLIFLITLPVGIVGSFILLSARSKYLVLMRVLGTKSRTIYGLNNLEAIFCSLLSYVLSLLIVRCLGIKLQLQNSLLGLSLAAVYIIGTNIALFFILRKKLILEVKKEMTNE